jgi:cytochrome c oxidase subunit IV
MAEHNRTPDQERYVESHAPYMKVFWVLLVLTVLEYGYARLPVSFVVKVVGLASLATLYAFLVAWFFMHLKFEGRWIYLMLIPVCVLTVVVMTGLAPDIAYHQFGFFESTAVADR